MLPPFPLLLRPDLLVLTDDSLLEFTFSIFLPDSGFELFPEGTVTLVLPVFPWFPFDLFFQFVASPFGWFLSPYLLFILSPEDLLPVFALFPVLGIVPV